MMETLFGLGLKSLLIASVTLGLLHLTRRRSAADRSWIAHLGLFALVALPLASFALPALPVEIAAFEAPIVDATRTPLAPVRTETIEGPSGPINLPKINQAAPTIDWQPFAYAVPALALLIVTLVALLRLFGLKGRAQVLVDPAWLSALAHAQRRMGFKNGTALLTSSELNSPISWGLMRPVILLNDKALAATGEAEAIIAHELAHVARLDWAKLMLARVATALFWFNPLAWVLAREAHQLREEAADDAVLGANVADTDYAQLLVGVARHECRGLLLGAHGISPGKGSLRRRVSRVLDSSLARSSGGRSWGAGFAAGMLVMAAPLAALTFTPKAEERLDDEDVLHAEAAPTIAAGSAQFAAPRQDLEIGQGAVRSNSAGSKHFADLAGTPRLAESAFTTPNGARIENHRDGMTVVRSPNGATVTTHAPDADGRRKVVIRGANGSTISYADARYAPGMTNLPATRGPRGPRAQRSGERMIERVIDMKAGGVTPEYLAEIRRVASQLARLDSDDAIAMRAVGVTPRDIQELAAAGFANLDEDDLVEARAVGVDGHYIRSMAAAGVRGSLDDYVEMRALGVNARDASRARARGAGAALTAKRLVRMKTGDWEDHGRSPPEPPEPPDVDDDDFHPRPPTPAPAPSPRP